MGIISRWASGRIRSTETRQGMNIMHKLGGWSEVSFMRDGRFVKMKLRSNIVNDELKKGHMRFNNASDRLYSEWINNTVAGKTYTARRQVEGMLKIALDKGDVAMAEELTQVLSKSDSKVLAYRQKWEREHSDDQIEQFYYYGPEGSVADLIANL